MSPESKGEMNHEDTGEKRTADHIDTVLINISFHIYFFNQSNFPKLLWNNCFFIKLWFLPGFLPLARFILPKKYVQQLHCMLVY